VETIEASGNGQIGLLHCTLCYPTDPKDSNLSAINHIREEFPDYVLGLSDHTLGTIVPAASVLYGVKVIEKHYTFDKTLPYSADHWLSLDEAELRRMVDDIRTLEVAIGHGRKEVLECETPAHSFARRSIVAATNIPADTLITGDMLAIKRPGTGLAPEFLERIVGTRSLRPIAADSLLEMADFR
jgi:sialic acid synthase SpsE